MFDPVAHTFLFVIRFDPQRENLYLADLDNRRVRAINLKTGLVRTVAGNGERGVPQDGVMAVKAPLVDPRAVAVDREGNVYVLEREGHALRVVTADGSIKTVVGTGARGNSGDGGEARYATMNGPKHLCVDHDGSVILADTENTRYPCNPFPASLASGRYQRRVAENRSGNGARGSCFTARAAR